MELPKWKFRIPQESEVNQDPIEGEFFTTQDVGDIADALVRESIQNSLDAKLPDSENGDNIVTVRFYFSGRRNAKNIHINEHPFFNGIYEHILSADNGLNKQELPSFNSSTEFIVIEDFQTTGLDGDINENDDPQTASPLGHNFYWFWRNIGRSGKRGTERGKWGLGKTVFSAASVVNTFWGLTNRYDDNKNFLMGLSVLKTHHLHNERTVKRYPYGYFGNFVDQNDEYFATPTDDENIIKEFRTTFNLKRSEHTSSGLSVVIPFPRKELNSKAIIRSVLRQYFHPVISGNLIVEVVDEDNSINKHINHKTIFQLVSEVEFPTEYEISVNQLKKLFDLCAWSIKINQSDFIKLNEPPLHNTPMWRKEWFIDDSLNEILKNKSDEFEEGERVAFHVPIKIQEKNKEPQMCWFKVFMENDELLTEADTHFVRNGITITGIRKPKNKNVRAIVVIEDSHLVKLLGDAENPAHTEWQKDSSHFRGKYVDGDKTISFIEKSIESLCSWLIKPTEGIDTELMKDIFYIELLGEDSDPDEPEDDEGEISDKPKIKETERKISPFVLEGKAGGFILKKNPHYAQDFSGSIKIETAYMVIKGSPLKKYSPFDFNLSESPIQISSQGINNLNVEQNKITFGINAGTDFNVEVAGFDAKRDLFIKVDYYD